MSTMPTGDQTGQNKNNEGGQNKNGRSNPDKIKTMKEFPAAENVPKIMQFLRMINELQVPNMAEENTPIRELGVEVLN